MEEKWDLVIEPKRHLLDLKLNQLWKYRDLLWMFVKRDITVVYKQTVLGPLWFFIQPIMTTLIYVFVFGNVANISTDGVPKPLFYMSGIVLWNYFSECFMRNSDTFSANAGVFGKVYFPRLITPLSLVFSNAIKFLIQFGLFLAVYAYFVTIGADVAPRIELVTLPLLIFLMALMGLGFGLIFSSMTTKYKDLKFLIQFGVQLLMYATPIIYPMSTLPAKYQSILWWNPITHIMEAFKFGFLGQGSFSLIGLAYSTIFTIFLMIFGTIIFNKTEQTFMDTV
jgi:lipopolysaccharide transport system permease protein